MKIVIDPERAGCVKDVLDNAKVSYTMAPYTPEGSNPSVCFRTECLSPVKMRVVSDRLLWVYDLTGITITY